MMEMVISAPHLPAQALLALVVVLLATLLLLARGWVRKSSLKNLAGPPSPSYLTGKKYGYLSSEGIRGRMNIVLESPPNFGEIS